MNNKRRRAMRAQRRAIAEYEDYLERRRPPEKLVMIGEILQKHEHHKEEENECGITYTVLFNSNKEAHEAIRKLRRLGCECHNESREWEDYNGQDKMWTVCWDRETIYGE